MRILLFQVVFEGDSLQIHCLISSKYNNDENLDQNTISPWSWTPHNSKQFSIGIINIPINLHY